MRAPRRATGGHRQGITSSSAGRSGRGIITELLLFYCVISEMERREEGRRGQERREEGRNGVGGVGGGGVQHPQHAAQ